MPHIVVSCFPAMTVETRPGLRAHPLSARRSRRSHESLGHNRSPRGRFGKMNVSGMTHLNALHRSVAIWKHRKAGAAMSAQSRQPFQSVTSIRSKREVQRQTPTAFLAERAPMVAGSFTTRTYGNRTCRCEIPRLKPGLVATPIPSSRSFQPPERSSGPRCQSREHSRPVSSEREPAARRVRRVGAIDP